MCVCMGVDEFPLWDEHHFWCLATPDWLAPMHVGEESAYVLLLT